MMQEGIRAKGKLRITLTSADGTIKQTMVKNTVVDVGLNAIISRLACDLNASDIGTLYSNRRYQIQTLSDGKEIIVDGAQDSDTSITVVDNTMIDSADLPLLLSGNVPAETYVTSKSGTTILNLNQSHNGLADSDTLEVGVTQFTDVGASANTVGTTFTFNFPSVDATSLELGHRYQIDSAGTTDFTSVGAFNNLAGTRFTATGTPSGNGSAFEIAAGFGTVRQATMSHMGIGSGTTPAAAADSDLETQITRVALGAENLTPPSVTYTASFPNGVGNGVITEAAIFNGDSSDADMLCRTVFDAINKGDDDALEIQWIITITR